MSDAGQRATIRSYLLGELESDERLRELEERVFADEEFYEELLRVEAELADEYAAGTLSPREREGVERLFSSGQVRGRGLGFALALREYLDRRQRPDADGGDAPDSSNSRGGNVRRFPGPRRILSSTPFRIAASAIILFALAALAWRVLFRRTDLDRGLVAFREAYREQRPTEARISALDYAPPPNQRGAPKVNGEARGRAERFLQYAVADAPDAASLRAFGDLLLASGRFDEAVAQFEGASKLDPNDAELQNDFGVALLERAKAAGPDDETGKELADAGAALERFDRALELDNSSHAALFNRALALERLKSYGQARETWEKYLEKDSGSAWASEARLHLERLDERRRGETSRSGEQLLGEFLSAYRAGDDARAWQIVSRNREAISGRLVSARLVDAYLDAAVGGRVEEAGESLRALRYAGELESKHAGDEYTAELARFYERAAPANLPSLARARELTRRGYDLCRRAEFVEASEAFARAKDEFESAGGGPEVYFVEYWIGYSLQQMPRSEESLTILRALAARCEQRKYKWLLAQALNTSANAATNLKDYSRAIEDTERSLALSEQVADGYTEQKNLAQQADKFRMLNNQRQMLKYTGRCLERADASWPGARQMWRNFNTATNTFYALGLDSAALAYGKEALRLSVEELKDPSTVYVSFLSLGAVFGRLRNHEEALRLAGQGLAIGREMSENPVGRKIRAYCALKLGELRRESGDFAKAVENYEEAISFYDGPDLPVFGYEAHKGKLLCHIALGDDAASERELRATLELVERNRERIREQENRNDYYDAEHAVYDLAVDFAYAKQGDTRRAFEYSEESRARTLLDLMRGATRADEGASDAPGAPEVSRPLSLAEIQRRMPERAQIVQYAVLRDKVVVWVVSKDGFEAREKRVSDAELDALVRHYVELASAPPRDGGAETFDASAALYDVLVAPVETLLEAGKLLCVVPDKSLNRLPFGALASRATGRYLIADRPVVLSPSASIFVGSSEAAEAKGPRGVESVLSVGGPYFDRGAFPQLPDLPSARREAEEVANYYDARTVLVGPEAGRDAVTRAMPGADVLHFASHYVVDEASPMSSKLLLAKGAGDDGVLKVYDLYRMSLRRTRLVVLAACQTGVEKYYRGEGMVGMARAFIAAGVPTVVASQWPVDSDATEEFMISFHRHRRADGLATAEALRRAQLDMLGARSRGLDSPYYWAAFVVIGGDAAR